MNDKLNLMQLIKFKYHLCTVYIVHHWYSESKVYTADMEG